MLRRSVLLAFAAAALSVTVGGTSSALHFCDAGTVITIPAGPETFYIHDRADPPGTAYVAEDGEGTWMFWENGKEEGLQVGGCFKFDAFDCYGEHDPCPGSPTSDDVIF